MGEGKKAEEIFIKLSAIVCSVQALKPDNEVDKHVLRCVRSNIERAMDDLIGYGPFIDIRLHQVEGG